MMLGMLSFLLLHLGLVTGEYCETRKMNCKQGCPSGWRHTGTSDYGCCASFGDCFGNRKTCKRPCIKCATGSGTACKTCKRDTRNVCTSCNPGYYLVSASASAEFPWLTTKTTASAGICKPYLCHAGEKSYTSTVEGSVERSGSGCRTCRPQSERTSNDQCTSCNPGYYLSGSKCIGVPAEEMEDTEVSLVTWDIASERDCTSFPDGHCGCGRVDDFPQNKCASYEGEWFKDYQCDLNPMTRDSCINLCKSLPDCNYMTMHKDGNFCHLYSVCEGTRLTSYELEVYKRALPTNEPTGTFKTATGFCSPRPGHCKTNVNVPTEASCKALAGKVGGIGYSFAQLYPAKLGHCEVYFDPSVKACPAGVKWYQNYWLGQDRGIISGGNGNSQWKCGYWQQQADGEEGGVIVTNRGETCDAGCRRKFYVGCNDDAMKSLNTDSEIKQFFTAAGAECSRFESWDYGVGPLLHHENGGQHSNVCLLAPSYGCTTKEANHGADKHYGRLCVCGDFKIPTALPTKIPTALPTKIPTALPTKIPTALPTKIPTALPTKIPTALPTKIPTALPTKIPTALPTKIPTALPTKTPTPLPTKVPCPKVKKIAAKAANTITAPMIVYGDHIQVPKGKAWGKGEARFTVVADTQTTVKLQMEVSSPDGLTDSFFVGFDGAGSLYTWHTGRYKGWKWRTLRKSFKLAPGRHTLIVKGRESGTGLRTLKISSGYANFVKETAYCTTNWSVGRRLDGKSGEDDSLPEAMPAPAF